MKRNLTKSQKVKRISNTLGRCWQDASMLMGYNPKLDRFLSKIASVYNASVKMHETIEREEEIKKLNRENPHLERGRPR